MKRILASLMAIVVATTSATSVVACGQSAKTRKIEVKLGDNLKYAGTGADDYETSDHLTAYNGGSKSGVYSAPLNTLIYQVLSIFSFNKSQITNPKKVPVLRKTFIGMDETKGTNPDQNAARFLPSVDGIYLGEAFEKLSPTEFYANYEKTMINSLSGLYQLYNLIDNEVVSENEIGSSARSSYNMAKTAFETEDGAGFINSFLSLSNQSNNSAWLSVTLNSDQSPKQIYSKVLPFNQTKSEDGKTTTYEFENSEAKYVGDANTKFIDLNPKRGEEEGHENDKMGNDYLAPFDLLMLPTDADIDTDIKGEAQATFDTSFNYPDKDDEEGLKAINPREHWDIRTPNDSNPWAIPVSSTSGNENVEGFIKTNESVIVPLKPLKIHLTYTTDTRDSKANRYNVDLTLEGLQAVFKPVTGTSQPKADDEEKIASGYVKWLFTNYQFTNQVDVTTPVWSKQNDQAGNGQFSEMKISAIEVSKIPD